MPSCSNGRRLPIAARDVSLDEPWYAVVSIKSMNASVRLNYGAVAFAYAEANKHVVRSPVAMPPLLSARLDALQARLRARDGVSAVDAAVMAQMESRIERIKEMHASRQVKRDRSEEKKGGLLEALRDRREAMEKRMGVPELKQEAGPWECV